MISKQYHNKYYFMETKEFNFKGFKANGFAMLFLIFALLAVALWLFFLGVWGIVAGSALIVFLIILLVGFTKLEPNEAIVMIFFGKYKGVLKETGFFWVNPFITRKKLSMRARNLNVEPIKVNDKVGNPVLIGLVLVWKLKDTYKAMFEIDAQTMAAATGAPGSVVNLVSKQMGAFEILWLYRVMPLYGRLQGNMPMTTMSFLIRKLHCVPEVKRSMRICFLN